MKRSFIFLLAILPYFFSAAQPTISNKKYPSLLWEITGNGLKKPSWLFGTMHVSSKVAFHLADSFYSGIKRADVVALETNPESWQEDMSKYDVDYNAYPGNDHSWGDNTSLPDEYLNINTLKFYNYYKKTEQALSSNPSVINNLLYRTYGNESSDFEENTYLDMYIYQCGKKWGKKVTGVEKYGESMKLMSEAYKDAAKDKNRKNRSFDSEDGYSQDNIQEAYRAGNLDLLDSINRYNSFSDAFDEKFLYSRNDIQAGSIDSILKSNQSLFVGVGAAHLPGKRGVIELLRRKGYHLRPVKMGERDSKDKEQVEKVRVPVTFNTQTSDDGFFKVDIPGKFYKNDEAGPMSQQQYADMANGSYYIVTRIMTNAWMWGHDEGRVYRNVDSLLYENIPGKILNKQSIIKNGYRGFDITNRTRRGDLQRYNIFITPFEIILFKISGNGNYINEGDEAKKFFGSIQLGEYKSNTDTIATGWETYSPPYGGFSVSIPHEPYISNDGSWMYDAEDKNTNSQYRVIRTDVHNYHFVEEDTFDLGLMDESFASSGFIAKEVSRKQITFKGYPALDCKYKDKNGSLFLTRFIIQGPHYFSLIAHGKQENQKMQSFLNSFEFKPYIYNEPKEQKDTSLYFTVKTPFYPDSKKEKIEIPEYSYTSEEDDDNASEDNQLEGGIFRNKIISDDSTGEKIYISFYKPPRYLYVKDSIAFERNNEISVWGNTTFILRSKKEYTLPDQMKVWKKIFSDAGSSRTLVVKIFYKDGLRFSLMTESDTLSRPSSFIENFFKNFTPADTLKGIGPFQKKSKIFFEDFFSKDSLAHRRAVKGIDEITLDSSDLSQLKKAVSSLGWKEDKYLDTKNLLIGKAGKMKTTASADYLKDIYYSAADTVELQYTALEALLQQQTPYAFNLFRDIIADEPPVLDNNSSGKNYNVIYSFGGLNRPRRSISYFNGSFMDELYDSLKLTKTILPALLPLLNLTDYKESILNLLSQMVDSGLVKPQEYESYFNKFLIEAKQELRKQAVAEKKKEIAKVEQEKNPERSQSIFQGDDKKDAGNEDLGLYATLLLPFWETNTSVQPLIQQMLRSDDKLLKYNTVLLLLRNNRPYPDSLVKYFASIDDYRYQLYKDLKAIKKADLFPTAYNNHIDLSRSFLLDKKAYEKPDSLVYVDRLQADYKNKKGFVYFFKYKEKKDDMSWKIAVVGRLSEDPDKFEFIDSSEKSSLLNQFLAGNQNSYNQHDFSKFTDTKIKKDEPLTDQLKKVLKKLLYSQRKSARKFYDDDNDSSDDGTGISTRVRLRS
ncbi:MAG TPA: TraB/GumN family protein [Chitinophagaceae bacterium]|nr:TraB/GumN family protein [Chitinophagaceae bacterium]